MSNVAAKKTPLAVLIALLLTGLLAGTRGLTSQPGINEHELTRAKLVPSVRPSTVFAGDSRILRGVSPEHALGAGASGLNFAFAGAGLGAQYLAGVDRVMDHARPGDQVVLGVTPHSLTPAAVQDNEFAELARVRPIELRLRGWLGDVLIATRPWGLSEIRTAVLGGPRGPRWQVHFHEDGWAETRREPEDPGEALAAYRERFRENQVSDRVITELEEAIRRWSDRGVRVVCFRPPSTDAMEQLEDELAGFDEEAVAARVRQAGGRWWSEVSNRYPSYDGSHLRADGAIDFSRDLGRYLAGSRLAPGHP